MSTTDDEISGYDHEDKMAYNNAVPSHKLGDPVTDGMTLGDSAKILAETSAARAEEAEANEEALGTPENYDSGSSKFNISAGYYDGIAESRLWAGWIEDDAKSWIIFLDKNGRPSVYYPVREANGAVHSNPQKLDNSRVPE